MKIITILLIILGIGILCSKREHNKIVSFNVDERKEHPIIDKDGEVIGGYFK